MRISDWSSDVCSSDLEVRGEVIEAVVVLRRDRTPTPELTAEIKACVKTGFAAHAYPRRVHYVSELPKTPSGKIQRFAVRENLHKIGRASCRERVCQYRVDLGGRRSIKKKKKKK